MQANNVLDLITAAVTPAVMISASAILVTGVTQKHVALAERVRGLTAEFRGPATPAGRKSAIRKQIMIFQRRLRYAAAAHLWLYVAIVCFIAMVLVMAIMQPSPAFGRLILALFILGVAIALLAVFCELLELRLSKSTIALEIEDVMGPLR